MNDENLISIADRPEDEQREISRKGGQASGEARRQRKTMRERLEYLMTTPNAQGIEHGEAIAETLIKCATDGNVKAAKLIGDYCGDFKQRIEVEDTTDPAKMLTREEATAIYWAEMLRCREIFWGNVGCPDEEKQKIEHTDLFRAACERIGKKGTPVEFLEDMNSSYKVEGAEGWFVKDFWRKFTNNVDFQKAIEEAAKMNRDEASAYLANAVKEERANNPAFEVKDAMNVYYPCLVIYLCARSEQWRKDHPDQAAPPPPPDPCYKPAPGQPYHEEW